MTTSGSAMSVIKRYGLAVVSVAAALAGTELLVGGGPIAGRITPLFFLAILFSAWVGGLGPALLAAVLAMLAVDYFFLPPLYSIELDAAKLPQLLIFLLEAVIVSSWSLARKRAETSLQQARRDLEVKVDERTAELRRSNEQLRSEIAERELAEAALRRQANLLEQSHDAILAWDYPGTIVYWNRGAEELYGFSRHEAIGRPSHELLRSRHGMLPGQFEGALERDGAWAGELTQTTRDGRRIVVESRHVVMREADGHLLVLETNRDITERKRAERALREQADLLALTHDAIFVRDMRDVITYWNRGAQEFYGWRSEDAVGQRTHDLLKTVFTTPLEAIDAELLRTGHWEGDLFHTRRDGTKLIVASRWALQRDDTGTPVAILQTNNDVTERRRAEGELRASEARFRTFVDHATDGFFLHDEHQTVLDVNRQACESLDYSRDELIGKRPRDFDAELDAASIAQIGRRVTAGETVTFETLHRRKDGGVFPVEIRVHRFQQDERVLHLALVRDISQRKRAEKHTVTQHALAQILADAATVEEATPRIFQAVCEGLDWDLGTLWRVDREARVLRCVHVWRTASVDAAQFEAATRESVFEPGVGLPGRVWVSREPACIPDVMHDPTFLHASQAARAGLRAAFAFPILLGGEVFGVVDFLSRDVRQPDPELLDLMASVGSQIGQFIERKRAEEALRVAQAELTHVTRVMTMGELTASIAHEVNQPLLGIVSSASSCSRWLAAEPPNLQRAQRSLDRIMKAGTRASAVIDRVRTLVKRQPLRVAPVDLNEIVREVIATVRHELQRSGVSLKTRLADELPVVAGDRVQLQQVVLNLILNAIEATREIDDRPRQVWVASRLGGGKDVHMEVRDSGVGLAPDARSRVFEAFYTTKQSGLGMGLSISKSIVEAHGGRISATANSPQGAVFAVRLPVASDGTVIS